MPWSYGTHLPMRALATAQRSASARLSIYSHNLAARHLSILCSLMPTKDPILSISIGHYDSRVQAALSLPIIASVEVMLYQVRQTRIMKQRVRLNITDV